MGFSNMLPGPTQEFARTVYDWGMLHVMVLGWASFAIMGAIYYFVPKAVEKELYSQRLGAVHFWVTNITFPIGIFLVTYGSFAVDPLVARGVPEGQIFTDPSILPFFIAYFIVFIIGYAAQFIFAYNIYKTMARKA